MSAIPEAVPVSITRAGQRTVFAVASGMFGIWGIALWMYNALFFKFSEFFAFSPLHVAWTMALFHVAYFLLAVPASLFHRQFGYKLGFLFGLSIFALGAFLLYLAIIQHSAGYFLGAVIVIGSCGAWLDTSLNPLAIEAGRPQAAVTRLNAAYTFNGLGLLTGYMVANWLISSNYTLSVGAAAAHLSARPYVLIGLGAILLAFLVEQISLPAYASSRASAISDARQEARPLLRDRNFQLAAAALFAYTFVLTTLWTSNFNYRSIEAPGHGLDLLLERVFFWFAAGRLFGAVLMRWYAPLRVLQASSALCIIAIVVAVTMGGVQGYWCLLSASFFLSIAYPTVFGSALCRHRPQIKLAAGLLAAAAGMGNALSSLLVATALHALNINARIVILLAVPFVTVILVYSVMARRGQPEPAARVIAV